MGGFMRRYLFLSALFLSLSTLSARANIVANPSFELPAIPNGTWTLNDSLPNWSLASGPYIEVQNHAAGSPFDGNQFVELDSTGESSIYQDLSTIAGAQYFLSFAFSPRPGVAVNSMGVSWNGSSVTTIHADGTGLPDTSWTVYSFTVTASSTITRLQFSGLGPSDSLGEYIDAVSVETTPEPSSIMLCFGGLLFAAARYRKHAARQRQELA
jgi:hypothetical protein